MAAFTVTFDGGAGGRLEDAEATTGYTSDGATPTLEPDFFYQGSNCISCLVKTSEVGFYYTSASTDMTTPKAALLKIIQSNFGAIDGTGLQVRIGSGTGAYYSYNLFTATTYPAIGGWQIVAIDPNVAQWRSGTTGSPSLSAVVYWGIRSDANATAKAPNLGFDAIDVFNSGTGLTGVGGDGASADGTFSDFVTFDEGNSTNRYGIVATRGGILYVSGVITIGSATETDFTDSNRVLVFPDHRVTTGFCGIDFGLQNANSVISISNTVFNGRGALYTSDDTRPDYTVTGTSGLLTFDGCTFNGYRLVTFNSRVTATSCNFIGGGAAIVGAEAVMTGSSVSGYTGAADTSSLEWATATDTNGKLDNMTFSKGTNAHHAIQFGDASTLGTSYDLNGITFSGFNATTGSNDSALYIPKTTGAVTINLVGCSGNISYKSGGATVTLVSDPVALAVNVKNINTSANIENARVWAAVTSTAGGRFFNESISSLTQTGGTATATVASTASLSNNDWVWIQGASPSAYNGTKQITVTSGTQFTFSIDSGTSSPATGTITATFVVINKLTDVNGDASATYSWSASQPISGRVRLASGANLYKTQPISGSIDSVNGLTINALLIPDS